MSEIVKLVKEWESFREQSREGGLVEFAHWLLEKSGHNHRSVEHRLRLINVDHKVFAKPDESVQLSGQAGFLMARLSRFGTLYAKPVMHKHGLNSILDFGFIATIDYSIKIGKKELCQQTLTETTTGMDIIRRIKSLGYVKEQTNEADKREKLLTVTATGKKVLGAIYRDLASLPDLLVGMPLEDRKKIVAWLRVLDEHHTSSYRNIKG